MLIKNLSNVDIEKEILNIGYDRTYSFKAKNKFCYKNFKIYSISPAQGNIIKQLSLSVGADCATHKEVITGNIEKSDCILGGNISQLSIIAKKLQMQPFGLKELGIKLEEIINQEYSNNKTKIMGILNITKDSFSDGGEYYKYEDAIFHLNKLIEQGADIIDIGAESTKPYSKPVSAKDQLNLLLPILTYINKNNINIPISIDTRSSQVAKECINYGVSVINDVSGLEYDNQMINVIVNNPNVKIIIQHSQGTPENMQNNPVYTNLMDDIFIDLHKKTNKALDFGIKRENIIIDPGIGFGKTRQDNFEIIKRWAELKTLSYPVLLGLSRKSLLNIPEKNNDEKDIYTLALNSLLINERIDYIRVHNVEIHKNLINLLSEITN